MDTQIVAVFCLCGDSLKAMHHYEDCQCQMSDAEAMTTAIVVALHFRGNMVQFPRMLAKSRFNRRLHRVQELFLTLFRVLGETWKELNDQPIYVMDSYPVAACDNYHVCRSRRYREKPSEAIKPARELLLWSENPYYSRQIRSTG